MAVRPVIALVLLAALTGCAGAPGETSDDKLGRMLVAPGKYVLYSCDELATQMQNTATRIRELEGLMARANVDSSGQFVSAIAYRPEYIERRGDFNELRNAAAARNCKPTPVLQMPTAPTSNDAMR